MAADTELQGAQDRIVKVEVTADESDDTLLATVVEYFRTGQDFQADADAFVPGFDTNGASASHVIVFSQVVPPMTHLVLESTFQA